MRSLYHTSLGYTITLLLLLTDIIIHAEESVSMMDRVQVSQDITMMPGKVKLVCLVTGIQSNPNYHEVQTYCPVVTTSKCLGNCQRICTTRDSGQCTPLSPWLEVPYVDCNVTVIGTDTKKVELIVDTTKAELAGQWYCKFGPKRSTSVGWTVSKVSLTPSISDDVVTSSSTVSTTTKNMAHQSTSGTKITQKPDSVWSPEDDDARKKNDYYGNKESEQDSIFLKFARPDYVIGILSLLGVSLLINLGFCIRCVFARHYIEIRKRKQQPPGYLARCLCVSTVQVDEKEEAYEEIRPKLPNRNATDRNSMRTTETTYMDGRLSLPRSTTMPMTTNQGLYYLQGVSDSMQRILYDEVPANESRPGSPSNLSQVSRHSRSRGSLKGHQNSKPQSLGSVPVVPEEVPFVDSRGAPNNGAEEPDDDNSSQYSGTTRLELSRMMLRKADTLLREANTLLKETAHESVVDVEHC